MTIILAVPCIVFMIILTVLYGCVMQERQNDMKTENPKEGTQKAGFERCFLCPFFFI